MLIGNQQIQNYFENLIKQGSLSHAYLFYGPEGVGKKLLAFKISELIAGPTVSNPDLKVIDKEKDEIHIADIRELKDFIHLTPFGKYKIAIINNANNLGHDASNALLKILEEPPGKSILFLVSHLPKMLLSTVVSRCQPVRFRPLREQEILDHLAGLAERGINKIKKDVAETCSKLSNGSLGLALELANNFEGFQKNINLLNKLMRADLKERFEAAKKISDSFEDLKKTAGDWFIYSASLVDKRLAKEILHLSNILSRPQFNHRLALENFMINL
ncbi:MAG: hypothetical protein AAB584_00895 [Patescibacteria group bacterium]